MWTNMHAMLAFWAFPALINSDKESSQPSVLQKVKARDADSSTLASILRRDGVVELTEVPGLAVSNSEALTALVSCAANGFDGFHRRDLEDHVERWTLAAHDDDRIVPHSVEERCSSLETDLAPLRVILGSLGRHLAHLMDDEYKHLNTVREHGGFRKALLEGRTLEHFHVYAKEGDASQWSVPPHVDNGAFLLLTKALDVPGTERSRFVLEDARGEMISPELSDDSALLLMGDSMRRFLGADVQVLRHAMKKVGSGMRAWHGRMYLFPDEMHNDDGKTAASMFLESRSGEQGEGSYWRALKADCDTGPLQQCWMQSAVCVQRCSENQLQECLLPDKTVGNCNDSNPMNDKCAWRCPAMPMPNATSTGFCMGATSMHMEGFTLATPDQACVILFFQSWKLDTRWKFALACIGVVLMGMSTQGLIAFRVVVQRLTRKSRVADSLMFGANVALGWAMMLVAMTFSTELFLCAVLGLVLGHFVFGSTSTTKILGTPCCNAVNDAVNEHGGSSLSVLDLVVASKPTEPLISESQLRTSLRVQGMTCGSCAKTVKDSLLSTPGVVAVSVSLEFAEASVTFQSPASASGLSRVVDDIGFPCEVAR